MQDNTRISSNDTLSVIMAVAEAIRDLGEVPSGHLYARMMGHMNLATYDAIIQTLTRAKLVTQKNHLLVWNGPKES
jgi:hypothetical protein